MKKAIALAAAVATAAFAAPAIADGGSTTPTKTDNGRHCGLTRGHHNGWRHHAKSHKAGRGCPAADPSTTTTTAPTKTDEQTTKSQSDEQSGDDNETQGDDNDAQGDDDAQDQQDD